MIVSPGACREAPVNEALAPNCGRCALPNTRIRPGSPRQLTYVRARLLVADAARSQGTPSRSRSVARRDRDARQRRRRRPARVRDVARPGEPGRRAMLPGARENRESIALLQRRIHEPGASRRREFDAIVLPENAELVLARGGEHHMC